MSFLHDQSLDGLWRLYIAENKDVTGLPDCTTEKSLEGAGFLRIPGKVPGNFELDLAREGIIDDPFFGENTLKLQELENRHLWYVRQFDCPLDDTADTYLKFDGIDTFSEIWLNGTLIGTTDNMLIGYEFPVAGLLKKGENELLVHIKPTAIEARKYPCEAGSFYHNKYNAESLCVRKAPHMFGWDIMPRALSGGIWRGVSLIKKPAERIAELYIYPYRVAPEKSVLMAYYRIDVTGDFIREYSLKIHGVCKDSVFDVCHDLWGTYGTFQIEVPEPKLWWTKGKGDPDLYTVSVELMHGEACCDKENRKVGIRSVELIRTSIIDDQGNGDFRFRINGEDLFVCGTNWVPLDAFHSRDAERLPRALALLDDSGCNMVRCWGGNVYESTEFYDFCDEHGIAVWQDFAMACAVYPDDTAFLGRLATEVTYVIKHLRQHPSIFMWSGDNECDEAVTWDPVSPDPNDNIITRKLLPKLVRDFDPIRCFLPSSPYIDEIAYAHPGNAKPEAHLWGPRDYYKNPFYSEAKARFASETGYHGCPSPESVRKFISPDKLWPPLDNNEWIVHAAAMETAPSPFRYRIALMVSHVEGLFGLHADNLDDFALASQISQAEAYKFFVERFRYNKPTTSGLIWWNLLDGWPQFSDAVVDYYFTRKLAYAVIKRSQQPLCLMMKEPDENGQITLCAVSDLREDRTVTYTVRDAVTDEVLLSGEVCAKADAVTVIAKMESRQFAFLLIEWEGDGVTGRNHYLLGKPAYDYETVRDAYRKCGLLDIEGF